MDLMTNEERDTLSLAYDILVAKGYVDAASALDQALDDDSHERDANVTPRST